MLKYRIRYTTEVSVKDERVELILSAPATELQIAEAAVRHAHPKETAAIGDVFDIAQDDPGMSDALSLMAEWGMLTIRYTVDDNLQEMRL